MSDFDQLYDHVTALKSKQVFFVCGAPKSGTTWVRTLLDSHPQVACVGEGHFANRLLPKLASALGNHNRLLDHNNNVVFRETAPFPRFRKEHSVYLLIAAMTLVLGERAADPAILAVGEKTPDNVRYLPLLATAFPRARFIHVVRDGRDCAVSCWFHNRRLDPKWNDPAIKTLDKFVGEYAKHWALTMRLARGFAAAQPQRYIELRYEDLVEEPVRAATPAFRFLGVAATPDVVGLACNAASFEIASGGRNRGEQDLGSFFRKGVAGDWGNHLTEEMARRFDTASGAWLARMGYQSPLPKRS